MDSRLPITSNTRLAVSPRVRGIGGGSHLLRSPPYTPSYNGACEAGNGSIKHRAETLACRNGTPGQWTLDHLEAARLWANRANPDRGDDRSTPEQRLTDRTPISDHERQRFHDTVDHAWCQRYDQLVIASRTRPCAITTDALARQAIADALTSLGVLTTTSRRVRLPDPIRITG